MAPRLSRSATADTCRLSGARRWRSLAHLMVENDSPMANHKSLSPNTLYIVTAAVELGAGVALMSCPSATATLLMGVPLGAPATVTVARVAGVALLALGVACWLARGDTQSRAAEGLLAAMTLYNLGVALILGAAGIRFDRWVSHCGWPWCCTRSWPSGAS